MALVSSSSTFLVRNDLVKLVLVVQLVQSCIHGSGMYLHDCLDGLLASIDGFMPMLMLAANCGCSRAYLGLRLPPGSALTTLTDGISREFLAT